MVAQDDFLRDRLRDDGCADGEPVAEGLGGGDDVRVGFPGKVGVCPELARAAEAALDFVVDEDGVDFGAFLAERDEEVCVCGVDPAFALDGLDDHAAGLRGDEGEGGGVVEGGVGEAREERGEGGLVFWVGGGGEGAEGAPVEGVVEGEEVVFARRVGGVFSGFAREFDGGFVCFGAGVADECARSGVHAPA